MNFMVDILENPGRKKGGTEGRKERYKEGKKETSEQTNKGMKEGTYNHRQDERNAAIFHPIFSFSRTYPDL